MDAFLPPRRHDDDLFRDAAKKIAEDLVTRRSQARDGSVYWLGPGLKDGRAVPAPLGPYLHSGTAGVVLFLAAMARASGGGRYRDLCLQALAPLRRELPEVVENSRRGEEVLHPLGGMSGLGSLVYALLKIGILLGEPELIRDSEELSGLITPRRILEDKHLDIMFGVAGALLALLALDRETSEPKAQASAPLDLAVACSARLLSQRTRRAGRLRVWPLGSVQRPLGGFAHGASGIACALIRLFGRTGEPAVLRAAREGIAYERTLYRTEGRNWRLSWRPGTRLARSWCNGASGIALSRLEFLDFETAPEAVQEIHEVLEALRFPELDDDDLLCCGNMGRVDALLHAARKLGDESLHVAARSLARQVLERARGRGGFGLMAASRQSFDPRLFLGLAGIGYTLLRLADPVGLPCVLALD